MARALPLLVRRFGSLRQSAGKYAPFDFHDGADLASSRVYVELKTRRNARDAYPTTVVPVSKLAWAKRMQKARPGEPLQFYFAFQFTDGLFYASLDEVLDDHEVKYLKRKDRPRGVPHAFIGVDLLRRVDPAEDVGEASSESSDPLADVIDAIANDLAAVKVSA